MFDAAPSNRTRLSSHTVLAALTAQPLHPFLDFDARDLFRLDATFLAGYVGREPEWGPLGAITFARTYPRYVHELGRFETATEVFARCVEFVMGTLAYRAEQNDNHWNPEKAQRDGQEMFRRMWSLKILPAGRGLANLGTSAVRWKGAACLFNCGFQTTSSDPRFNPIDVTHGDEIALPAAQTMDYLMLGVGVGFDLRGAASFDAMRGAPVLAPETSGDDHRIEDTREGWVASVVRLCRAFRGVGTLPRAWDTTGLRKKGEPLKTFGGVSSGPAPLIELLRTLTGILFRCIGRCVDEEALTDIENVIGRCVVAGGVRRSSEIALGPMTGPGAAAFSALKDPEVLRELLVSQAAREAMIPIAAHYAGELTRLRAIQAGHSVLSPEFAQYQDEIDSASTSRSAALYGDVPWAEIEGRINAHPLRAWRWASNNSVLAEVGADYSDLGPRIAANGEPGVLWLDNVRRYGRMADGDLTAARFVTHDTIPGLRPDPATGVNPCQPAEALVLTPDGIRTFADLDIGATVWSGQRWTRVIRKVATGVKPVLRYRTTAGSFLGTADHRIVQSGVKVPVGEADAIDRCIGPAPIALPGELDPQDVMDGLLLGDGGWHGASRRNFLHQGAGDDCYDASELAHLLGDRSVYGERVLRRVSSTLVEPLPRTYERRIPARFLYGPQRAARGFLRGLYAANGSVCGERVTLKAASRDVIDAAQAMLSSLGIGSYVTTNPAHAVEFANGEYECRESYDLNVATVVGRDRFRELIGFLHPDKAARLDAVIARTGDATRAPKVTYDVVSVEALGDLPVFDITVEADEHTYWTAGLLVSNCGEIGLESGELCNLVETFPSRHESVADWHSSLKYAYLIAKAVSDVPLHNPATAAVQTANRRLGISVTGITEWYVRLGLDRMCEALDKGYRLLRSYDRLYSGWLGLPESIRLTTVKPSGTVSLLAGVEGGMRFPEAQFCARTIRIHDTSPLIDRLTDAGYRVEPDRYAPSTVVAYFPLQDTRVGRYASEVSIWEQAQLQAALQRWWSDNLVSATWTFRTTEARDIPRVLAAFDRQLKGMSALPIDGHSYVQPPYAPITEREHAEMSNTRPLDLTNLGTVRDREERFCEGGSCSLPA